MATHLYLIRHGEAVCNVDGTLAGMRSDVGLTELGVAQAERLRDRLAVTGEIQADALIASTLPRAQQTAQIIAPALGLPIIPEDDAQELRLGEADGLTATEFVARFGPFADFRDDPYRPIAPGGESWAGFVGRVGAFLYRTAHAYAEQTVVVVCHGGVVDASLLIGLGVGTAAPGQFHTRNTSITHWTRERIDMQDRWRLNRYNDNTHTRDLGAGERIIWAPFTASVGASEPAAPLPTEEMAGEGDATEAARGQRQP